MDDVGARLKREMADVAGLLYVSGGAFVLLSVLLPHGDDVRTAPLAMIAGTAVVVGALLLYIGRRVAIPVWAFATLAALGAFAVSGVVYFGGPGRPGAYAIFYVFVVAFAFYYFDMGLAVAEVLLCAILYAATLHLLEVEAPWSVWTVATGGIVITGATIARLGAGARRTAEQQQEAADRLRQLDQMKTTFLQAVSHELRTPLTAVSGYSTLLRRHGAELDEARLRHLTERLSVNAERLQRLLVDLLDVDRLARGVISVRRDATALGPLVHDALAGMDLSSAAEVIVETDSVVAFVDAPKMIRVLENLIANALRHGRGPVRVRCERVDGVARVTVEDEGPGVPDHLKHEIFETLRHGPDAARSPSPGTGVGLSLVRHFVELHGGEVWVEDRPGGGARFVVELPQDPPGAPARRGGRTDADLATGSD